MQIVDVLVGLLHRSREQGAAAVGGLRYCVLTQTGIYLTTIYIPATTPLSPPLQADITLEER